MNDIICKYFNGELTEKEKEDFLIRIEQLPSLREEFIEIQNLIGMTELLPHREDLLEAKTSLSKFMEYLRKNGMLI